MSLIGPASTVPDSVLQQMYTEHVEEIRRLATMLEAPPYPVIDPSRVALARAFAEDVLLALTASEVRTGRPSLVNRVNLSYEAMLILIDYAKTYTAGPKVPRSGSSTS